MLPEPGMIREDTTFAVRLLNNAIAASHRQTDPEIPEACVELLM